MTSTLHKTFIPEVTDLSADGSGQFVVATLKTIDLDGDVTMPGFFGKQSVALLPAHDHTHVPLGKGKLFERGDKALVEFQFNLKVTAARDWFEAIKFDFEHPPALQQYSYGYRTYPDGHRKGTWNGRTANILQPRKDGSPGAYVFEVSPVLLAAGISTRTTTVTGSQRGDSVAEGELAGEYLRFVYLMHGGT